MLIRLSSMLMVAALALPSCGTARTESSSARRLTVWGDETGLKRFVTLQTSRTPALAVGRIEQIGPGKARATVSLPAAFTGHELVQTTREALSAGLSYRYAALTISRATS